MKTTVRATTEKTTTLRPSVPYECRLRSYDTFFDGVDDKTYAVSGNYYWYISRPRAGKESGPHKLTDKFPDLETPVDAALTKNGKTLFFKGSK